MMAENRSQTKGLSGTPQAAVAGAKFSLRVLAAWRRLRQIVPNFAAKPAVGDELSHVTGPRSFVALVKPLRSFIAHLASDLARHVQQACRGPEAMSPQARFFVAAVVVGGCFALGTALSHFTLIDPVRFSCYLLIALAASGMKVSLPGINGTMSVNFLFILLATVELGFPGTLVLGCAATLVQCYWNPKRRPKKVQVAFNVANVAISITATYGAYTWLGALIGQAQPLTLITAAAVYFLVNTVPVAIVISLTENRGFRRLWNECYFWSFPYYLVGAGLAGTIHYLNTKLGWEMSLLLLPAVYVVYRSYRIYLGKLSDEKRHVEDMANLHLRTIEALALAIEAKDHTTHDHLQRVRVYAVELGKELAIADDELEALRAAALLHDIGKLAVPEHIISKPGRLTREEFEKMKIHPLVGAEILEQVKFPYPVVPIVRAHHERWDGSGYPFGLKGEEIPMGARILAAVDCLDALASDRQYRRALPLDEAMDRVESEGGKSFDPAVVVALRRTYRQLEQMAARQVPETKLTTEVKVANQSAPASGLADMSASSRAPVNDFVSSIAAARQEVQMLFELSHDLGSSLSLDETLSVLSLRLKRLVPYDAIAIYVCRDNKLIPEFASGDNFRLFSSLEIPIGGGVTGWVAQNCTPILNGNPMVEPGYRNEPQFRTLRSALAVPLEGLSGVLGVMTLYCAAADAFSSDHLRILLAISGKLAFSMENALKYQVAEASAITDYLTGLPNARSLFVHLDGELARCKREKKPLAVLVCDLDGFKQINDKHGHLEGNRVLRTFATRVKQICREYDYVSRMGGDEFVVVAPGLTASAKNELVRRIEQIAREVGAEVTREQVLSVSVGEAYYPQDGNDAEQLLSEADRRMYQNKACHHAEAEFRVLRFPAAAPRLC